MILVAAIAFGLVLGQASRGDARRLVRAKLRGEPALLALLFVQFVLASCPAEGPWRTPLLIAWCGSLLLAAILASVNWRQPGVACLAAGLWLNFAVVVGNQGMPVLPDAALAANAAQGSWVPSARDFVHVLAGSTTRLLALADVIPVPWPARSLASAGDVMLLVGAAAFAAGIQRGFAASGRQAA